MVSKRQSSTEEENEKVGEARMAQRGGSTFGSSDIRRDLRILLYQLADGEPGRLVTPGHSGMRQDLTRQEWFIQEDLLSFSCVRLAKVYEVRIRAPFLPRQRILLLLSSLNVLFCRKIASCAPLFGPFTSSLRLSTAALFLMFSFILLRHRRYHHPFICLLKIPCAESSPPLHHSISCFSCFHCTTCA